MYLDLIINNNTELKSYKAFLDAYHDGLFILSKDAISWFCIPDDLYEKVMSRFNIEQTANVVDGIANMQSVTKIKPEQCYLFNQYLPGNILVTPKIDGCGVMIQIDNGVITRAHGMIRRDGKTSIAQDRTEFIKHYIKPIDKVRLAFHQLVIRGEFTVMDKKCENPANVASGFMNRIGDIKTVATDDGEYIDKDFSIIIYELVKYTPTNIFLQDKERTPQFKQWMIGNNFTHLGSLYLLSMCGFTLVPSLMYNNIEQKLNDSILMGLFKQLQSMVSYPLDGIVLNDPNWIYPLEERTESQYGKYAFKPTHYVEAICTGFEYSVGKNGLLSYLLLFNPIKYAGKEYRKVKCKLHQLESCGIGSVIYMECNGGILSFSMVASKSPQLFTIGDRCGYCHNSLTRVSSDNLYCYNPQCQQIVCAFAKNYVSQLSKILSLNKVKVGEATLEKWYSTNNSLTLNDIANGICGLELHHGYKLRNDTFVGYIKRLTVKDYLICLSYVGQIKTAISTCERIGISPDVKLDIKVLCALDSVLLCGAISTGPKYVTCKLIEQWHNECKKMMLE